MFKKYAASALVILAFAGFSSLASAEDSLYQRLGGTYAIAQVDNYLVDMIYINKGLTLTPR